MRAFTQARTPFCRKATNSNAVENETTASAGEHEKRTDAHASRSLSPAKPRSSSSSYEKIYAFDARILLSSTRFTIFCSSIMNARTMRSRTALADRQPPYARLTVRFHG